MLVHPDDWLRVRELFEGALALPASERHAYLETACRNVAIREQVERMLESHQQASGFLEGPPELTSTDATSEEFKGLRLGPYQLVSRLGAGGMGVVFRALDTRLDRTVAIKLLSAQVVGHSLARERFEQEARAIALETALRQADAMPHRIAQPEIRRWYAGMLLDTDSRQVRDKARTLLGEALGMYQRLGMPRHVEMVAAALHEEPHQ